MSRKEDRRILIVDDDQLLCSTISLYLSKEGITTVVASDGKKALQLFAETKPDVVVADLRMPVMDGLDFLENIKKTGSTTPVIITTGNPDMSSAIRALQDGAYDYLLKPVHLPVLVEKIHKAFETSRLTRENMVLSEVVSLYNITSKLAATHNTDALLDVIFRYGLELTGAPSGAIYMHDGDRDDLVYARQRGMSLLYRESPGAEASRCSIAQRVLAEGKSLMIENGVVKPAAVDIDPACKQIHALMAAPLGISDKIMGVFMVERNETLTPFSPLDFNRIEIIAAQAGIALNNAELYLSLNKKLEALKLVSSFSEQISGRMDKYELLESLFAKVSGQCPVDVIGFLLVQQHRHEFYYWTRGSIDEVETWNICRSVIDYLNETMPKKISERRVVLKKMVRQQKANGRVTLPLTFQHLIRVTGESSTIGVFFVGASKRRPEHVETVALIDGLVNQMRIALVNAQLYNDMKENYLKTIKALAIAVDAKDNYTRGHSEKVMTIAEEIAREMGGCDDQHVTAIRDAALLHDIGKIGIPGHILNKPSALSFDEFNGVMKKHSTLGANIVKDVPFLNELYKLILHHHEHYDGSGYPEGLKGEDIPLGARILHVADAFDAMTSDRPYRSSLGHKEAIRRIVADSGKHFDPAVVGVLLRVARRKGIIE
ncbi:MAG: HD domain-containing phosphohydrolase [Chitinispirillaceae bacterium]